MIDYFPFFQMDCGDSQDTDASVFKFSGPGAAVDFTVRLRRHANDAM